MKDSLDPHDDGHNPGGNGTGTTGSVKGIVKKNRWLIAVAIVVIAILVTVTYYS